MIYLNVYPFCLLNIKGVNIIDNFLFKISDWHTKIMRKKNIINDENYLDKDMIFRGNLYNIISTIIFCITGILIGHFTEMITIFLVFNILRDKCNGIHSYGNLNFCTIISLVIFILACFLCDINMNFLLNIISIFCIFYSFRYAPYINDGYDDELIENKYTLKFDYLVLSVCFYIFSYLVNSVSISNAINIAIILVAIFMNNFTKKIFFKIRDIFYKKS